MTRLALFASLLLSSFAFAQVGSNDTASLPGATPVILATVPASTLCVTSNVAAGSQAIATVPALPGQFFYVTYIGVAYGAIVAPVATLVTTTTTNFPGSFVMAQVVAAAVGETTRQMQFAMPIKSAAAGVATTITGNAAVTSVSQNIRFCGYYAK